MWANNWNKKEREHHGTRYIWNERLQWKYLGEKYINHSSTKPCITDNNKTNFFSLLRIKMMNRNGNEENIKMTTTTTMMMMMRRWRKKNVRSIERQQMKCENVKRFDFSECRKRRINCKNKIESKNGREKIQEVKMDVYSVHCTL